MKKRIISAILLVFVAVVALIPALGLNANAASKEATITFDNKSKITSSSTTKQVWEENGIQFIYEKGASTSNLVEYANPTRVYANTKVTIQAPGNITKIVVTASSSSYATALKNSIASSTATVSASGSTVTITPASSSTSFVIAKISAQTRLTKMVVTYDEAANACEHTNTTETTTDATCTKAGSIVTTCDVCEAKISTKEIPALGHNYVDLKCTRCGDEIKNYSGTYYIATKRSSGNYWYMTNDLGTSGTKRYTAVDSGLDTIPSEITSPDDTMVFVIEMNDDGTHYIYAKGISDTSNYLGWNSDNSGLLVSKSQARKFIIKEAANNTVNIIVADDTSRYLSLNNASTSNYFAFYAGTQKQDLSLIPVAESVPTEFTGASLNVGSDLSIKYHVTPGTDASLEDYTVLFTTTNNEVEVAGVLEDGKFVFTFCGITPQCMGDTVKAELLFDGEVVDEIEYSVKSYVAKAFELYADNETLLQFLSDMLYYGAEAQKYTGYKTDALVTDGIELLAASTNAPVADYDHKSIVTEDGYDKTLAKFTAAGVNFDYNNKIFVKFTTSDIENVEICINGASLEIKALGDGKYIAYSYAISALEFENAVDFELYYDGELAQTLTYTVIDYVAAMQNDSEIGALVNALYNYGVSAKNYDSNK